MTFKDGYIQKSHIRNSHTTQNKIRALDTGYHEKEKLIVGCQQCELKFPTKAIGAFHQKYAHRADKNWQCQYCKKTFPQNKKRGKIFKHHMRNQHSVTDFREESRTEDETYRKIKANDCILFGNKLHLFFHLSDYWLVPRKKLQKRYEVLLYIYVFCKYLVK